MTMYSFMLTNLGVSKVEMKSKNMLTLNKGQMLRIVKHSVKHQFWAVLNSCTYTCLNRIDVHFQPKSQVKVVDTRKLTTDFSSYPRGKRQYSIDSWNTFDPYDPRGQKSVSPRRENAKNAEITKSVKFMAYLKLDLEQGELKEKYPMKFLEGKEGDIVLV